MDPKQLVRDPAKVHSALIDKNNQLIALRGVRIYTPLRYRERKLANIGTDIRTVGIFGIVVDDKYYGVSKACAMMTLTPDTTNVVEIDGVEYYEFGFDPGSVVCPNTNLVKTDTLVYFIYDEIVAKGHIPWYFSYEDLGKLFLSSKETAGVKIGSSNVILEMIAASISRNPKDLTKFYRHQIRSIGDLITNPPSYIPFRSIIYGATNTTARLLGAYFDDNLLSALVNPSEKVEGIESLLRA